MTCDPCAGMGKSSSVFDPLNNSCEPTGLVFTPEMVFFGDISVTEYDFTPAQITVRNSGKGDIHIQDVRVVVGAETFSLVSNSYPSVLRGGQEFLLQIRAAIPSDMGDHLGVLEIVTNEVRINYSVGIHARFSHNDDIADQIGGQITIVNETIKRTKEETVKYVNDTRDGLTNQIIAKYNDALAKVTEEAWVRASADEAEAGHRLTLEASLGNEINSKIVQEQIARVTQYEAFASSTESLFVQFKSDTEASINVERLARATAILAEATTRETLAVTLRSETDTKVSAGIMAERTVRVTAEAAIAQSVENLRADFETGDGASTAYVDAQITNVRKAYADADSAQATTFTGLLASYAKTTDVNSKFTAEATDRTTAIANAIAAEVTRTNNLVATSVATGLSSANSYAVARVADEATARATAISAESTSIRGLFANYVSSDALTSAISAEVTNRNAAISNATGGFAQSIEDVRATANTAGSNASAAVTTASSAETKANSALAKWALKLDANGYVGGMEANNDGQTVTIVFNSDLIQFRKPGGGAGLFMAGGELWATDPSGNKRARFGYWA